jgi:hypothetical protein
MRNDRSPSRITDEAWHVTEHEGNQMNENEHQRPRRVMVAVAHPDDAEFGCAGTVAKWAAEGQEIIYVLGTSGDKGSDDVSMTGEQLMEIREAEQRAACDVLGVKEVVFLRMRDAELVPDLDMRRTLTRVIRQYKPDAVICQDPTARWEGSWPLWPRSSRQPATGSRSPNCLPKASSRTTSPRSTSPPPKRSVTTTSTSATTSTRSWSRWLPTPPRWATGTSERR